MVAKQFMLSLLIFAALAYSSVRAITDTVINGFFTGKSDDNAAR
jgi:hypothetical protein